MILLIAHRYPENGFMYLQYASLAWQSEKFQCLDINPRLNIDSNKQTVALQIEDQIITNASQIKLLGLEAEFISRRKYYLC